MSHVSTARLTMWMAVGLSVSSTSISAVPPPAWQGVWEGTLGNLPVRACFVQHDANAHGAYYYLSHLNAIPLDPVDGPRNTFAESAEDNPKKPRWILGAATARDLSARWVDGSRTLPVRLKRLSGLQKDENPCGSMLFHRPRLQGVGTTSKPTSKDGVRYTKLALDHHGHFRDVSVETFQLVGNSPQVQRINAQLLEPLSGEKALWFDCMRMVNEWSSIGGEWNQRLEPKLLTKRWLTVADNTESFCGGAHPEEANIPRTFDLSLGQEIRLHDWLNEQAVERVPTADRTEDITQLTPKFRTFVIGTWKPEEAECGDAVRKEGYWHIELTRTALVLTPDLSHVERPCWEEFTVPFSRLGPYLSTQGKAGVVSVGAETSAK